MECRHGNAVGIGRLYEIHALKIGAAEGLFGKHVEAMAQQILGDGVMHLREGGIDDEIDVVSAEQLGIIGNGVTAEFLGGTTAAELVRFNNANDLAEIIVGRTEEFSVNISTASALADDGNS